MWCWYPDVTKQKAVNTFVVLLAKVNLQFIKKLKLDFSDETYIKPSF
jgi:hypothetical protein